MDAIKTFLSRFSSFTIPREITKTDILEILIIAFALYHIIIWVKKTRAWMLVKGIIVLLAFSLVALLLDMTVILWIFKNTISVGITAVIIMFQPELRKALEQLGRKNYFSSILPFDDQKDKYERYSERTINEIVKAVFEMAKTKTGALIVIERDVPLNEFERTGISIDSLISSQLIINIFEHNTPLHDGAVIVRGNRIVSATCYLPLSDNMELSKELGTRHRAGVGVSEVSDGITIIVSEETGKVSLAVEGEIIRAVDGDFLKEYLVNCQKKKTSEAKKIKFWRERKKHERKADK